MYMCESLCSNVYVCTGAHGGQERVLNFLQLELQAVLSCQMCVLGTELSCWRSKQDHEPLSHLADPGNNTL